MRTGAGNTVGMALSRRALARRFCKARVSDIFMPETLPESGKGLVVARPSDAECFLHEGGRGLDRLGVGALLVLVPRRREAVLGAAIELVLEVHLGGAQRRDDLVDLGERRGLVLGAVQDQDVALHVLGAFGIVIAERAVDRDG